MTTRWDDIKCAKMAVEDLRHLAELRLHPELSVTIADDHAWVSWNAGNTDLCIVLARCLVSLAGIEIYAYRDGLWYHPGEHLPVFCIPDAVSDPFTASAKSMSQSFAPAATHFEMPERYVSQPRQVRMIRDDRSQPRPTTALLAPLTAVVAWADAVPAGQLARLEAAWTTRAGHAGGDRAKVLLVGQAGMLPLLSAGSRFWGSGVLVPLGFRLDPELPTSALRRLAGARDDELLLWDHDGCERIDRAVFHPLDRARLAMAGLEAVPGKAGPSSQQNQAVRPVQTDWS